MIDNYDNDITHILNAQKLNTAGQDAIPDCLLHSCVTELSPSSQTTCHYT